MTASDKDKIPHWVTSPGTKRLDSQARWETEQVNQWPHEKPAKITQGDIDDYNALPAKEKIKAWESLKRLEAAGEIEPMAGRFKKPEGVSRKCHCPHGCDRECDQQARCPFCHNGGRGCPVLFHGESDPEQTT